MAKRGPWCEWFKLSAENWRGFWWHLQRSENSLTAEKLAEILSDKSQITTDSRDFVNLDQILWNAQRNATLTSRQHGGLLHWIRRQIKETTHLLVRVAILNLNTQWRYRIKSQKLRVLGRLTESNRVPRSERYVMASIEVTEEMIRSKPILFPDLLWATPKARSH